MNRMLPKSSPPLVGLSHTRQRRRAAVVATYLGYLAMSGAWYVASAQRSAGLFVLVLVLGVVMLTGLAVLLTSWVWYAANETTAKLDERQQQVRDRAYLHSYRLFAGIVTLVAVYGGLAWDTGLWLPQTWNQVQAVVWGVLLAAMTLPSAVVAWTAPDAPAEL